ncbi:MAG: acyl-CoA dehydrogenase family protein [Ilumatobacteraceae bacterium]|nr:acyl-CoA dehydrogenase family protein [Ilumatobacter sp.]MCB0983099.1 acyl-CoA dehydrogenase family protein [Ilumatobacter sp.]MCB9382522.1 acyl-CoA dehydrogenase family protein [Acidimicrobiaceae bacterium]
MDAPVERPWWPVGDQFLDALRHWLENNFAPHITVREWWRRLADTGLTAPTWPRQHGGLGVTTRLQEVIERELAAARALAPPVDNDGFRAIAPALRQFLPDDTRRQWLEPLLRGEHTWDLLVAEPRRELDDVRCRADWEFDTLTITGAKLRGTPTTHALVMTRTDPASTGRLGLTCVIVDLAEPGVTLDGDVVRFDRHTVTRQRLVGHDRRGWEVASAVIPYLQRSLAGRIRRGLTHVPAGEYATALDMTVADALAAYRPAPPPGEDRRRR